MPQVISGEAGEQVIGKGTTSQAIRQGTLADVIVSELEGRYFELCRSQRVFIAQAVITTPVIYSTAAAGVFPLLWNGSSNVNASLLWATYTHTAATTTTGSAIGLTCNTGQTSAPTSVTAIDGSRCLYLGGPNPSCSVYNKGTVANAGAFFFPLGHLHSGTIAVDSFNATFSVDLGGSWIVPPNAWAGLGVTVAPTTSSVQTFSLIWAETPI